MGTVTTMIRGLSSSESHEKKEIHGCGNHTSHGLASWPSV
jgi:hypothetical protein